MSKNAMIFLMLDGGDEWVRLDQVARMRLVKLADRHGVQSPRTEIVLIGGQRFMVKEGLQAIGDKIQAALEAAR